MQHCTRLRNRCYLANEYEDIVNLQGAEAHRGGRPPTSFYVVQCSLCLRFNGHFPGGPGLADTGTSPFWILSDDEGGGCNWNVQISSQIVTTNKPTPSFLQAECPSCRPSNSARALLVATVKRLRHILILITEAKFMRESLMLNAYQLTRERERKRIDLATPWGSCTRSFPNPDPRLCSPNLVGFAYCTCATFPGHCKFHYLYAR